MDYPFPLLFDETGKFLQQFGKPGGGPGEFRRITPLVALPGDSVLLSVNAVRLAVVAPDLQIARMIDRRQQLADVRPTAWPDSIVALTYDDYGASFVSRIQLFGMAADSVATLGVVVEPTAPARSSVIESYRTAAGMPGSVWTWMPNEYSLQLRSMSGEVIQTLLREPDWFPRKARQAPFDPFVPRPQIRDVLVDSTGYVWVVLDKPRPDFVPSKPEYLSRAAEVRVASAPAPHEMWSTVVEVIDPTIRRVIARAELDEHVLAALGPSTFAATWEDSIGVPYVSILRMRLQQ